MLWLHCGIPELMGNINLNSILEVFMLFPGLFDIVTATFDHAVYDLFVVHEDWMGATGKNGFS